MHERSCLGRNSERVERLHRLVMSSGRTRPIQGSPVSISSDSDGGPASPESQSSGLQFCAGHAGTKRVCTDTHCRLYCTVHAQPCGCHCVCEWPRRLVLYNTSLVVGAKHAGAQTVLDSSETTYNGTCKTQRPFCD